ncbi:fibrinogen-like protein 1 [Haematobia irritans]|uniref:fibrinogen-like protein 1 n=1 Tax=Haematobia irritans TaxID=7368 RepID=UPI003F4FD919
MRFLVLLLICFSTRVSCKFGLYNSNQEDRQWNKIFTKLNEISNNIEKLNQGQEDLHKRLENLENQRCPETLSSRSKRGTVEKFVALSHQELKDILLDFREDLNFNKNILLTNIQEYRRDYNERQTIQENLLRKSFSYNQKWTTILSRNHYGINNATWSQYKRGYSDNGFYFIGLEALYIRTTYESNQELMVILKDWDGNKRYAKYDHFQIGDEDEQYALRNLGKYMGNAGDALRPHLYQKFSTYDRDNDDNNEINCAAEYGAGWWFYGNCSMSLLTGPYRYEEDSRTWGISWSTWRGWNYSLKSVEMLIRPAL